MKKLNAYFWVGVAFLLFGLLFLFSCINAVDVIFRVMYLIITLIMAVASGLMFYMSIKKSKVVEHREEELPDQYKKFTYHIRCTRCNVEFSYKYAQVLFNKDWEKGYVRCPYCDAENAHTGIRFTLGD